MSAPLEPLDAQDPYGDLLARLQGAHGATHRAALLRHLRDLEADLSQRAQQGAPSQEFAGIESALLAVQAGIATLQRVSSVDAGAGQTPLTQPVEFFKGEAA